MQARLSRSWRRPPPKAAVLVPSQLNPALNTRCKSVPSGVLLRWGKQTCYRVRRGQIAFPEIREFAHGDGGCKGSKKLKKFGTGRHLRASKRQTLRPNCIH